MKDFSNEIFAYALKNAVEYGKADPGRILPKLFQHGLEKKDIRIAMIKIQDIIEQINKLTPDERKIKFEEYQVYLKEKPNSDLPQSSKRFFYKIVKPTKLWTQIGLPFYLYTLLFLMFFFYFQIFLIYLNFH